MKRANTTLLARDAERGAIPLESVFPACVTFFVPGKPQPQGSMNAWVKNGRAIVTSANPQLKAWRQAVGLTARAAGCRVWPKEAAIEISAIFVFRQPKGVKREYPTVKPDVDKLLRAIFDALTMIAYEDDSQVVQIGELRKVYGETEGAQIALRRL